MQLTPEQKNIIHSKGDLKINAVAGSGKTTTIIEYARARSLHSKILYLAFNKSVRMEATKRFAGLNLNNVKIETAHSLAFKYIITSKKYKIKSNGYKISELVQVLELQSSGDKLAAYILANHVLKFATYFCNSPVAKVQELNYLDVIYDPKAQSFVRNQYAIIEKYTRLFLSKMDKNEIELIHDFYLKKFQLSQPELNYDWILFDEGQDASPAMLDVFFRQSACKIIVGDVHQQIYSWRYAINSLDKADFNTLHLTNSFRFDQEIADLAMDILAWKSLLAPYIPIQITGSGKSKNQQSKAVLARTNLGLLINAIKYLSDHPKVKRIYFEGNINSYTYAEDGASLYDVLNLYNYEHDKIRDPLIKSMKNIEELEDYIEKTEDMQLSMMVSLVKEYENEIYEILRSLKEKHVTNDERENAEVIFSTVHRCKGMEYDIVYLAEDFISERKIKNQESNIKESPSVLIPKYTEEINLLYVAITRTKHTLYIPEDLLPGSFIPKSSVRIIKTIPDQAGYGKSFYNEDAEKKSKLKDVKRIPSGDYKQQIKDWQMEDDDELYELLEGGWTISQIAEQLSRPRSEIRNRIKKFREEGRLWF